MAVANPTGLRVSPGLRVRRGRGAGRRPAGAGGDRAGVSNSRVSGSRGASRGCARVCGVWCRAVTGVARTNIFFQDFFNTTVGTGGDPIHTPRAAARIAHAAGAGPLRGEAHRSIPPDTQPSEWSQSTRACPAGIRSPRTKPAIVPGYLSGAGTTEPPTAVSRTHLSPAQAHRGRREQLNSGRWRACRGPSC